LVARHETFELVAGRHRLEAARSLGWMKIACVFVNLDERQRRMWEIAENLHRGELTFLERSEHQAEWARLASEEKAAQVGTLAHHGLQAVDQGIRSAAKQFGKSRSVIQRSVKIDGLTPGAKAAAREMGLDDNQSALLQAAKAPPEEQLDAIHEIARRKSSLRSVKTSKQVPAPPSGIDLAPELGTPTALGRLNSTWDAFLDAWLAAPQEDRAVFDRDKRPMQHAATPVFLAPAAAQIPEQDVDLRNDDHGPKTTQIQNDGVLLARLANIDAESAELDVQINAEKAKAPYPKMSPEQKRCFSALQVKKDKLMKEKNQLTRTMTTMLASTAKASPPTSPSAMQRASTVSNT
jgi:ParB-like nuclease domain